MVLKQDICPIKIDRFGEEISLDKFATQPCKSRNLLSVFCPFSHDFQLESVRQSHDQSHEVGIRLTHQAPIPSMGEWKTTLGT
jgi:hypothetical protein